MYLLGDGFVGAPYRARQGARSPEVGQLFAGLGRHKGVPYGGPALYGVPLPASHGPSPQLETCLILRGSSSPLGSKSLTH